MADIEIRLSFDNATKHINFDFTNAAMKLAFFQKDREFYFETRKEQIQAEQNTKIRKAKKGNELGRGRRVHTDDYHGEPPVIHPGIHFTNGAADQIVWVTDDNLTYMIDFGPDPELAYLHDPLPHTDELTNDDLHCEIERVLHGRDSLNNPFQNLFPLFLGPGPAASVRSGLLKNDSTSRERRKKQRFYKYSVRVLGAPIILDPHIDFHNE